LHRAFSRVTFWFGCKNSRLAHILDGGFLNSSTAVAVPKGKPEALEPEALEYVSQFVEDAKASGLVRRAFDSMNLQNSQVAPAGMKP
jgi:polar amino acid transport system substrate-binding protein